MKSLTITQLQKKASEAFKRIPPEGMFITKDGFPIAHVFKPDVKVLEQGRVAVAREVVRELKQVDTFTQKEVVQNHTLGRCSRCGTYGDLVESMYLNEFGKYQGKYLCSKGCLKNSGKTKEMSFTKMGDFGAANE